MNIYLWIHISELYMNTHSSWPLEPGNAIYQKPKKNENIFLRYFFFVVVVVVASIISMILFIEMRIFYCCHPWYIFMAFAWVKRNFESTRIEWNQDYWRAYVDNKLNESKHLQFTGFGDVVNAFECSNNFMNSLK